MTFDLVQLTTIAEVRLGRQRSPKNHLGPNMRPYVRAANVTWDGLDVSDIKRMNFTDEEMAIYRLQPGDLLLSEASGSPAEVGKPAIWSGEVKECAFQNTLVRVRPGPEVSPRYLFHYFKHQARIGSFARGSRGVGIHHLGQATLARWSVPLPTLSEQRGIAAILDQADSLRAERHLTLNHLDELAHSIFLEMFGHPTTSAPLWPRVPLGQLARVVRGASPRPAGDPRYFGGSIPWLKISDVTTSSGRTVAAIKQGVTEAGRDRSVLLPSGTLVLTNSATVGIPKIVLPATCIHDGFLAFLELSPQVNQTWLYAALLASRASLVSLAPEGTQKNLNGPIVKAFQLPLPPIELQRAFARRLVVVEAVIRSAVDSLREVDELIASLASTAFGKQERLGTAKMGLGST